MTITLDKDMQRALRGYINAKHEWANDPARSIQEARSYAAEFVSDVVAQLGGEVSHEQHMAYKTGGPSPFQIQLAATLAKLEVQS